MCVCMCMGKDRCVCVVEKGVCNCVYIDAGAKCGVRD